MTEVTPRGYYNASLQNQLQSSIETQVINILNNEEEEEEELAEDKEISTLFVVGFPENIKEREFQNMFLFSPGFEAATLKIPNKAMDADMLSENRKQIIGFVKFRTRLEAMIAKQVLCGKKMDTDCILKAEMAKKNLHIKKNEPPPPPPLSSRTTYEAFHSVPAVPAINDTYTDLHQHHHYTYFRPEQSLSSTTLESFKTSRVYSSHQHQHQQPNQSLGNNLGKSQTTFASADYPSKSYPITFPTPSNSTTCEYLYSPNNSNNNNTSNSNSNSRFYQSFISSQNKRKELQQDNHLQFSIPSGVHSPYRSVFSSSSSSSSVAGSTNLADQNPPCNTLYVGNLPQKTNDQELLMLFSKCTGYKRLSFRTKSNNGPMCFVEFDNISCATQALQDLYGHPLSNSSAKGGIRLSFSKNPLGVRSLSSSSIQQ